MLQSEIRARCFDRGQIVPNTYNDFNNTNKVPDNTDKMPDSADKVPDIIKKAQDSTSKMPDTIERLPDNEQEQQIYKYVLENGSITTAETVELLGVKRRRARAVLMKHIPVFWNFPTFPYRRIPYNPKKEVREPVLKQVACSLC